MIAVAAFLGFLHTATAAIVNEPVSAVQTGPAHRVIVADDSTKTLAAIGPDGRVEWELPCRQIHDLHVLPNGHILYQDGWTRVVELDAERKPVWQYDAKGNGNGKRAVEVHAFQPIGSRAPWGGQPGQPQGDRRGGRRRGVRQGLAGGLGKMTNPSLAQTLPCRASRASEGLRIALGSVAVIC